MTIKHLKLQSLTGAVLAAADDDGLLTAFTPTSGSTQDVTGSLLNPSAVTGKAGYLDWARTIECTHTISAGNITSLQWFLVGYDIDDNLIQETLEVTGAPIGTGSLVSTKPFARISSCKYLAVGTVSGDSFKVGWSADGKIGLPKEVTAATKVRLVESAGAGDEGTFALTTEDSLPIWTMESGNKPDGVKAISVQYWA